MKGGVSVTRIDFQITGGAMHDHLIGTSRTVTIVGWTVRWITTGTPDGTYALQAVAHEASGRAIPSAPVTVSIDHYALRHERATEEHLETSLSDVLTAHSDSGRPWSGSSSRHRDPASGCPSVGEVRATTAHGEHEKRMAADLGCPATAGGGRPITGD